MQKLIAKYGLAAHLAILAVAPLFLSSEVVLWLSVPVIIWVLMEPSRVANEMLHDARNRVASGIARDPFFWVMMFLVLVATVRSLNGGVAFAYDAEHRIWSLKSPCLQLLPGCVSGCGFAELGGVVALMVTSVAAKHALGRSARQMFIAGMSIFAAIGAAGWIAGYMNGAEQFRAAAQTSLTKPMFAGTFFGIASVMSVLALLSVLERRWYKLLLPVMLAIAANWAALFVFAPPLVAVGFVSAALVTFVYAFVFLKVTTGGVGCFKFMVLFGIPLVIAGFAVTTILEPKLLGEKIAPFTGAQFVADDARALYKKMNELSLKMWRQHPWQGTGVGSYALNLGYAAAPADWESVPADQTAPLSGYWMLLVERGTVGAFLMALPLVLMLLTYFKRLARSVTTALPHPIAVGGLLGLVVAAAEAAVDASFLITGVTVLIMAFFTVSTATFPKEMK